MEEHSALLRRCRDIGVPGAFNEKTSDPSGDGIHVPSQDDLSRAFAAAFYQATLENPGCTLAQAVRAARQVVRQQTPHDPTWLAYALYAHPNARLAWDGSRG